MLAADTERESEREGGRERERERDIGRRRDSKATQKQVHEKRKSNRGASPAEQLLWEIRLGMRGGMHVCERRLMKEVALRQFKCDSLLHSIRCFNLHWKQQTDARSACLEEAPYCSGSGPAAALAIRIRRQPFFSAGPRHRVEATSQAAHRRALRQSRRTQSDESRMRVFSKPPWPGLQDTFEVLLLTVQPPPQTQRSPAGITTNARSARLAGNGTRLRPARLPRHRAGHTTKPGKTAWSPATPGAPAM